MPEEIKNQGVEKAPEKDKPISPQGKTDKEISDRVWRTFDKFRQNRNLSYNYFRGRNIYEYLNDNNSLFNNYKVKPSWKEEWQANISDITTHAKLMAIIANIVSSNFTPEFYPQSSADFFSTLRAKFLQDIYLWTDTTIRNGQLDMLFTTLKSAREGTCLGFEGWKKTSLYEGIDTQFVAVEDFYPGDMTKFRMQDQLKCVWRTVMTKDDFDNSYSSWYNYDKVKVRSQIGSEERSFFNISQDVTDDQVEILRYFDRLNDEFYITANSILMTKAPSKLSTRRKDKQLGFWKSVYEPFDDNFFFGRALPDLLRDNQEGIDFLFNAIFDKEMLTVLRPILVGGVNQMVSDYWFPGKFIQVTNVDQVKEMPVEPPDLTSFRVLKELQDRSYTVSVDQVSSGIALGGKTATEVERAQEAARKLYTLFSIMLRDAMSQKAMLRGKTIIQYMFQSEKYKSLILRDSQLMNGKMGTKILRIKSEKELAPKTKFGYSPQLEAENTMISGQSEIWEFTPKEFEDFDFYIGVRTASSVEMSQALKKAFTDRFTTKAYAMPMIFNQKVVAQMDVENNKDIIGPYADDIIVKSNQGGNTEELGGGELGNEMLPTQKAAIPKLKSLLSESGI